MSLRNGTREDGSSIQSRWDQRPELHSGLQIRYHHYRWEDAGSEAPHRAAVQAEKHRSALPTGPIQASLRAAVQAEKHRSALPTKVYSKGFPDLAGGLVFWLSLLVM